MPEIKQHLDYIKKGINMEQPHLVITVHGISYPIMEWQKNFKKTVESANPDIHVENFIYGYFSGLIAWFGSIGRVFKIHEGFTKIYLGWLNKFILKQRFKYPNSKLTIVAHSYGGWVVAELIKEEMLLEFNNLILVSTPLPRDIKATSLYDASRSNQVHNIYNWHSKDDLLIRAITFWPFGDSGCDGFKEIEQLRIYNRGVEKEDHNGILCKNLEKYLPEIIKQIRS